MSGTFSQLYGPQFAGGVFQVACEHIGPSIIEGILKQFPRRKMQRGDMYADGARNLLRTNLEIIDPAVQANIKALLQSVADNKEEIESARATLFQRIIQARKYKCRSKELYVVVKKASDRGINESLINQMKRALGETEFDSRNPFSDPPLAQSLTHSSVGSLDRVELTTYEADATGDMAVGLTLHNEDTTTEGLLAQIPPRTLDTQVQTITIIPLGVEQFHQETVDVEENGQKDASDSTA